MENYEKNEYIKNWFQTDKLIFNNDAPVVLQESNNKQLNDEYFFYKKEMLDQITGLSESVDRFYLGEIGTLHEPKSVMMEAAQRVRNFKKSYSEFLQENEIIISDIDNNEGNKEKLVLENVFDTFFISKIKHETPRDFDQLMENNIDVIYQKERYEYYRDKLIELKLNNNL